MIFVTIADGNCYKLILETEEEKKQFKQLIDRATNTWDTMPKWVRTIADHLNNNPVQY